MLVDCIINGFQDQEWDVVNVVERRTRTQSESQPPDGTNRSKYLRVDFSDIKSFKVSRSSTKLTFYDGKGEAICTFEFKHGNCDGLVTNLRALMRTAPTKRDKHIFIVLDNYPEAEMLDKSFAGLNLFAEEPPHIWKFLKTFQESPYTAGMEAFAKISDIGNYVWTYYLIFLQIGILLFSNSMERNNNFIFVQLLAVFLLPTNANFIYQICCQG